MNHKWTVRIAILSLVLAASAASAASKSSISVFGGLQLPTGDFSDENKLDAKMGFHLGAAYDYMINDKFAVGVDGSWSQSKHGAEGDSLDLGPGNGTAIYDKDKFTTVQFGAHAKYFFPTSGPVGVYGLAGLGVYTVTEKWEGTISPPSGPTVTDNGDESTDARFGGKVGLGGSYKVNEQWGVGAEADFNFITEDKDKVGVSSLQYVSLKAMVTMHIGP